MAGLVAGAHLLRFARGGAFDFSTDFHNSFEFHPSCKPFPSTDLNATVSNSDAHSNNNIVILDTQYLVGYSDCCFQTGGERSAFPLSATALSSLPPAHYRSASLRFRELWALRAVCVKSDVAFRSSRNSFRLNFFADPHPLNPAVSILYKNSGVVASPDRFSDSRYAAPLNHLESTLMRWSTSVDSNGLTEKLNRLDATLMKNRVEEVG